MKQCDPGYIWDPLKNKCVRITGRYSGTWWGGYIDRNGKKRKMVMEKMVMVTVMGPITGMEVLMAMVAVMAVGTATVVVAALVKE